MERVPFDNGETKARLGLLRHVVDIGLKGASQKAGLDYADVRRRLRGKLPLALWVARRLLEDGYGVAIGDFITAKRSTFAQRLLDRRKR